MMRVDQCRWLQNAKQEGLPPQLQRHMQQNVRQSPSFTAPDDRTPSELQLAVKSPRTRWEAVGFVVTMKSESRNSSNALTEKKHFESQCVLLFLTPLCGSHDSRPPHTSCVWEWVYGWQKRMKKRLTQGQAMGAKLEGIMGSLTQKAPSSLQEKICAKKKKNWGKVSCFVKTQLWLQNCCREKTCFFFFSFFTLLQRYCLSTRHHWSLWAGGRVHVHKNHCSKTL